MESQYFEYIVVGLGGVGSGALYWLSKRVGKNVLGLEQFELGHVNGGSQDVSRIIRLMYHDDKYTRLTRASYDAWRHVEEESGLKLISTPGSVDLVKRGDKDFILNMFAESMRKHSIPFESLSGSELRQRFPQFEVGDDYSALYQPDGGLVDAALANSIHVQLASGRGATVLDRCPVQRLQPTKDGDTLVYTPQGVFRCRRLVVAAGAWINHVLGSVGVHIPITVTQEQVTYLATPHTRDFTEDRFPVYIYHGEVDIYGLPIHSNSYSKIGVDCGGPAVTPESRTYDPDPVREAQCVDFLKQVLPKAVGPIAFTKTCLYTMPADRDFVVDSLRTRGMPQILVCCGAGHAFKFASLLGQILTDLAVDGHTACDVTEFRLERPAINDPQFPKALRVGASSKDWQNAKL